MAISGLNFSTTPRIRFLILLKLLKSLLFPDAVTARASRVSGSPLRALSRFYMVWISKSVNSDQNGRPDLPLAMYSILLSVFPPGLTEASLPVTQEERKKTKENIIMSILFIR